MLETLAHSDFTPLLGTVFTARSGDDSTTLELAEVRPGQEKWRMPGSNRLPFSLFFRGPEDVSIMQGTFELSHPDFPTLTVTMTPVGCSDRRFLLQAVFN